MFVWEIGREMGIVGVGRECWCWILNGIKTSIYNYFISRLLL